MIGKKTNDLLLLFAAILLGLYLAELSAQLVFLKQNKASYSDASLHLRQRLAMASSKDAGLIADYNPSLTLKAPGLDSSLGEYRELFNFRKRAGVYRILCIGGSTTRGVGVNARQSYPALLRQGLEARAPGKYEVFNLGLHGGNTSDFIRRFYKASNTAEFGWRDLKPDLVIIAPVWNDLNSEVLEVRISQITGSLTWQQLSEFIRIHLSSRWALGHYIYLWAQKMREDAGNKHCSGDKRDFYRRLDSAKEDFYRRLSKEVSLWKDEGVKVYLIVFPGLVEEWWSDEDTAEVMRGFGSNPGSEYVFFSYRKYPAIHEADREVVSSVAKNYATVLFDFSDLAKGIKPQKKAERQYFVDAIHLGARLNAEIAGELAGVVVAESK